VAGKAPDLSGHLQPDPRFCPRADTPIIAFTGRDERLVFDIFTYDLRTGRSNA